MITHGEAPFLECSSKGFKPFSAFYAQVNYKGISRSIEEHYQRAKVFSSGQTNLSPKLAKGKQPVNAEEVSKLYAHLWDLYMAEHPEYQALLKEATGLSDMFGQQGHNCQATELWRIRKQLLANEG